MPYAKKKCVICGAVFRPISGRAATCSKKCSLALKASSNRASCARNMAKDADDFPRDAVCENPACGKSFRRRTRNQRYCCTLCARTAAARRRALYGGLVYCHSCERWLPVERFPEFLTRGLHRCDLCIESDEMPDAPPAPTRVCHHPGCNVRTANFYCDEHRALHFRDGGGVATLPDGTAEATACISL